VKSKVKNMLTIFFGIKGTVHKEFVQTGPTVDSACYCDVLWRLRENVWRILTEIWRQKKWPLHHDNTPTHTSSFNREFFTKNITVVLHPPLKMAEALGTVDARGRLLRGWWPVGPKLVLGHMADGRLLVYSVILLYTEAATAVITVTTATPTTTTITVNYHYHH
jgi:hypothetical protein